MNINDFNDLVENRLNKIKETLINKGNEYANEDRLSNFKLGAKKAGWTPIEVLKGYLLKHEVSFDDLCRKFSQTEKVDAKLLDEKVGDIICYYILAEALMKEENIRIKNLTENLK